MFERDRVVRVLHLVENTGTTSNCSTFRQASPLLLNKFRSVKIFFSQSTTPGGEYVYPRFFGYGSVKTVAFICRGIGNLILLWRRWDVHIGLKWDNICSFFYFRVKILQWHNRVITSLLKVVTTSIGLRIPATSGSLLNISFIACCIFIFQSSLLNWVFTP